MAVTAARPARVRRWAGVAAWALWALTVLSLAVLPWLDRCCARPADLTWSW